MDKFEDVDLNSTSNSKKIPILQKDSFTTANTKSGYSSNNNISERKSHSKNIKINHLQECKIKFFLNV